MRRKSIDLFSEAKKRFQFKPVSSRKLHVQQILDKKTLECSSAKERQKENNSKDIPCLDKLVAPCDVRADQHQQIFFDTEEKEVEKAPRSRKSISKNNNIIRMLKQKQLNDKSLSMKGVPKQKPSNLLTQQRKAKYIKKQSQIQQYSNQNMAKKGSSDSRDLIVLSLSGQSSIRNDQKSGNTEKSEPKSSVEGSSHGEVLQTSVLELDGKVLQEQIDRNHSKLNVSDSLQITVLKITDTYDIEVEQSATTESNIQVYGAKQPPPVSDSRSIGRIKKNNLRLHTIEVERCSSPVRQYYLPQEPLRRPEDEKGVSKYLKQQRSAIVQEDQLHSLSTSRAIQTKLSQIFNQLDTKQMGHISRNNCNNDNLNESIKTLIESIVNKIIRENKSFTKEQFFSEICKVTTSFSEHELHRLFTLPVLNFSNRRRSTTNRMDSQHKLKMAASSRNSSLSRNRDRIRNYCEGSSLRRYAKPCRYQSTMHRIKTENYDLQSVNMWRQLHKQYEANKSLQRKRIEQLKRAGMPKKQQRFSAPVNHPLQSSKVPSWNSTMAKEDLQPRIWRQPHQSSALSNEVSSSTLARHFCESQSTRIQKINQKLQRYICQYIPEGASSFEDIPFR